MTDYYPLLSRAVAGLDKNTSEARRALYERARTALVDQLRNATPPLSEPEITRERLALEESVRKVEAEAARQMRFAKPGQAKPEPRPEPPPDRLAPPRDELDEPPPRAAAPRPPPERPSRGQSQWPADRASISSDGIRGFRDVVAEA